MATKVVVYRGVKYRRYSGRRYYVPSGDVIKLGGTSLHRQIWIDHRGPIPDGFHIHHKDHDYDNNNIGNFECVPAGTHALHHYVNRKDLVKRQRKWAKSKMGKRILRENIKKARANTPKRALTCSNCGKSFETRHPTKRFCSPECQESANAPIKKICPMCGSEFMAKKHSYKEVKTCSYRCGWALRRKKASLQSDD